MLLCTLSSTPTQKHLKDVKRILNTKGTADHADAFDTRKALLENTIPWCIKQVLDVTRNKTATCNVLQPESRVRGVDLQVVPHVM
ncbi:hypothetical protein Tco_1105589 [Tanacetum coccineum]